jgi:tetratricopeptide (TPR) repeat protein/TolB-like protein
MRSPPDDPQHAEAGKTAVVERHSTFAPGDVLSGRFRVERFIARGGMGEVYAAHDSTLDTEIAVKTIRPEIARHSSAQQRFLREIQLARRVTHPNICRIFDLFEHTPPRDAAGSPAPTSFVTMELLKGETLDERLRREGAFSVERALPIVAQMVAALSAAHAAGVIHRDFKTGNVMLLDGQRDEAPRTVVTDFGLAYSVTAGDGSEPPPVSLAGEILGTPGYMAPEQLEGGTVTPATDVYALGIVLYEMVTGARPFAGNSRIAAPLRKTSGPTPPREIVPALPAAWNDTILRCLARSAEDRFASADDVLRALTQPSASLRHRRTGVAAAVVAALALAAAGSLLWHDRETARVDDNAAAIPAGQMRPTVAVLGFRNLAGRADTEWLSVALAEMLSAELATGNALRAIPGETVYRMKADLALADADSYGSETLAKIRENLGSDLVVSGSYVTVGDGDEAELRVDIRLQDARAGETIAVITETGRSGGLLELVTRAGGQLRGRIGVEPEPTAVASVRASLPTSPAAARLYTEGLTRLRRLDALGARELLEQAVEAEPGFALAHSALAASWAALGYDNRAREAAERALALSTDLPRAERLQVEAVAREMAREWPEAIANWETLAAFFPDDVEYALKLANAQAASGAARDALVTIEGFRARFPAFKDPRLDLAEARAADTLSDFERVRTAAAAAATIGATQGSRGLIADARVLEGGSLMRQGKKDEAIALFEEARAIYEAAGDRGGVARTLNNMGAAFTEASERDRASALYEEGLAIARAIGNQDLIARFLNNRAIIARRAGDLQASLAMNEESLRIRREIGDRANAATSLNNIGNVLLDLGDFDGATRNYEESSEISREIGDRRGLARALRNAAEGLLMRGEIVRARTLNEEALAIRRGIADPQSVSSSLVALGTILAIEGRLEESKQRLEEALAVEQSLDDPRSLAYAFFQLGEVALLEANFPESERRHREALALRTRVEEPLTSAESRYALAVLALEQARPQEAETLARDSAESFARLNFADGEALARAALARALLAQNRSEDAKREIVSAQAVLASSQRVIARLPVSIVALRLAALTDAASATRALEALRADARERRMMRWAVEAHRAIVEIQETASAESGVAARAALRADALENGLPLYAR